MVSQVASSTLDLPLTRRGPSSVISASSSRHGSRHRSHRSGRSHAGGSAYAPQNEFPVFSHSGDVEIVIRAPGGGKENRYLLHRLILAQASGFFEAGTSQEWSRAAAPSSSKTGLGELAKIGEEDNKGALIKTDGKRWRYELDLGAGEDVPMLVQKEGASASASASLFGAGDARPPPVRNKPPASNSSFFRSVANLSLTHHASAPQTPISQEDEDLLNDYDNLLRIFYNYNPGLDGIDIATAYIQCKALLSLADLYDALPVVGPRVDHHLLQFQSRLWKQVAKYPASYLKLGYLAQSRSIFQEALIHVVGAWPVGERHLRNQLPDQVLEIIEDKVEDLADLVGKIEARLFRLTLYTSRGDRVTPQNSYLDWLAVSLFRQWLADNTVPLDSPPPPIPATPAPTERPAHRSSRPGHAHSHSRGSTRHAPAPSSSSPSPHPPITPPQPSQIHIGRTYRTLGAPSSSSSASPLSSSSAALPYLPPAEIKRFLKLSPDLYSRDNLKKLERRVEELKDQAREVVRPLMKNFLLLGETEAANLRYLVCTRVGEGEMPW